MDGGVVKQLIKMVSSEHPHWGPKRIADLIGVSETTVSSYASRIGVKFMSKRDLERLIDGKTKRL